MFFRFSIEETNSSGAAHRGRVAQERLTVLPGEEEFVEPIAAL